MLHLAGGVPFINACHVRLPIPGDTFHETLVGFLVSPLSVEGHEYHLQPIGSSPSESIQYPFSPTVCEQVVWS